jgi:predicted Zn-dependent protease
MPVRSHGCAARTGRLQPILQLPNLTLKPGAGTTSLDDLVANIKQGYYVEDAYLSSDQQQLNVQVTASAAYEIVRGKLGAAVVDMGLQFTLPRFWQSLVALGGVGSAKLESISVDQSDPDRLEFVGACTVPALVRQLNVMSDGKEA